MGRQQPARGPSDGAINVQAGGGRITISEEHNGQEGVIVVTEFNAYRILAALSLILDAPLSKAAQKSIKL